MNSSRRTLVQTMARRLLACFGPIVGSAYDPKRSFGRRGCVFQIVVKRRVRIPRSVVADKLSLCFSRAALLADHLKQFCHAFRLKEIGIAFLCYVQRNRKVAPELNDRCVTALMKWLPCAYDRVFWHLSRQENRVDQFHGDELRTLFKFLAMSASGRSLPLSPA